MALRHQLDVLALYDPDRAAATANVWIAHPSPSESQVLGMLFVLTTIESRNRLNHDVISLLQEELRSAYYAQTDRSPEIAFEHALQETNRRLHELTLEGIGGWLEYAHILVGALTNDQLLMTSVGNVHAYVIRQSRLHNLLEQSSTKPSPLRVFEHVISGQVFPNDQILLCSASLLEYFSLEKLRRTLLDNAPSQTVRALESALLGVEPRLTFGAIVIQLTPAETPATTQTIPRPIERSPHRSMEELIDRERTTEQLLSPSVWPAIRDVGQQFWKSLYATARSVLRQPQRRVLPRVPQSSDPGTIGRPARPAIWPTLVHAVRKLHVSKLQPAWRQPKAPRWSWTAAIENLVGWYQRLPRNQSRIIVGLLVILLVFSVTLTQRGLQSAIPSTNPAANPKVAAIEEQISQAEAAILFGGDEIVQRRIDRLRTGVAALPNRTRQEREQKTAYEQKIQDLERRLARVVTVARPTLVADVAAIKSQRPLQLYRIGDRIVTVDPHQNLATIVSTTDQEPIATSPTLDLGQIRTGAVGGTRSLVLVMDRNTFVELDVVAGTWKPLAGDIPGKKAVPQALAYYQNRLYLLEVENQAIVRYARGGSSLTSGTNWLREPTNLSAARAIGVDGTIFILQPGGMVERYATGRRNDFSLNAITPKLNQAERLWTDENSANLYLVDAGGHRVVIFDKQGKLVRQYRSDAWTSLRDAVANEQTKTLFVLNGSRIEQVSLTAE